MPFAAALSLQPRTADAWDEARSQAAVDFGGPPDLAVLFFSPHHLGACRDLAAAARRDLQPRCLIGCVAEGVIGNDREAEDGPGLSLWLARWGSPVELEAFHLVLERTSEGPSLLGWPDALVGADAARTAVLLLGDPFTFPVDFLLRQLNDDTPGVPVL